jgi:FkbH-like protein
MISLSWLTEAPGSRAFELVNKTNQFNLNGRRYTQASWASFFEPSDSFAVTAAYRDKFGDLGTVTVLLGRLEGSRVRVASWVLSCRAFSRRIEHRLVRELFRCFPGKELFLDFEPTGRNGPLIEFFELFLRTTPSGPFSLTEAAFEAACPPLHHTLAREEAVTQA